MTFLDPAEGVRIDELLKLGQPVAAAKLLLASSHRDHKAIRPLVTVCIDQLISAAKAVLADQQILTARQHVQLAAELHPLSGDHAALHSKIVAAALEFERRAADENAALERSRKLAEAGRLQTSIESLAPLQHLRVGQDLLKELTVRDGTVQRQVTEFTQRLNAGDLRGAEAILVKIEDVAQSLVDALGLRHLLSQAIKAKQEESAPNSSAFIDPSTLDWMLDFGHTDRNTRLYFGHALVIGSDKVGTSADIRVPGIALHQQHAIILRHFRHGEMRYWLMPHPSHDKYVGVNGVALTMGHDGLRPWARTGKPRIESPSSASALGCALLNDGDIIELGGSPQEVGVRLVFRQRLVAADGPGDDSVPSLRATASLQFEALCPGSFLKERIGYRNLALVHKEVRLGSPSRGVDLPLQMEFDCAMDYRLIRGQLTVDVDGGTTELRIPEDDTYDENIIQPHSVLVLKRFMESAPMRVTHRCW